MKENEKKQAHLLIITGLSGAGKTSCAKIMEDIGYYCIDNLPVALLSNFIALIQKTPKHFKKTAVVMDTRDGENFSSFLLEAIDSFEKEKISYAILFMDASEDALVKRFSETRRKHPLSEDGSHLQIIQKERKLLEPLRDKANFIVDTTHYLTKDLRDKMISIDKQISQQDYSEEMNINILSFGFKAGVPIDADIMMDVRFLPNPYYDCDLKDLNGLNDDIAQYVMGNSIAKDFISKTLDLLFYVIPLYHKESKNQLTLAFGCTGGKHRSVAIAEEIGKLLKKKSYRVKTYHRDINFDDLLGEQ